MKWVYVLILVTIFLPSCSLLNRHKTYTWDWRRDNMEYHVCAKEMIMEEAPDLVETVPEDIENYKPDYEQLSHESRLEFWGMLLSSISWMESSHRTDLSYEENGIKDQKGNNVISRGLLQLSYESARSYLPELETPEQLHDPNTSLRIGAIALNRFIQKDGAISKGKRGSWQGAARYWSVMRKNAKHEQIQEWLKHADYQNPKNNLIPPPPHIVQEKQKQPWYRKVLGIMTEISNDEENSNS